MGQLNSVLWGGKITHITKKIIYAVVSESIVTYGSKTWEINQKYSQMLQAVDMRRISISNLMLIKQF